MWIIITNNKHYPPTSPTHRQQHTASTTSPHIIIIKYIHRSPPLPLHLAPSTSSSCRPGQPALMGAGSLGLVRPRSFKKGYDPDIPISGRKVLISPRKKIAEGAPLHLIFSPSPVDPPRPSSHPHPSYIYKYCYPRIFSLFLTSAPHGLGSILFFSYLDLFILFTSTSRRWGSIFLSSFVFEWTFFSD